jgi:hypothetical protein
VVCRFVRLQDVAEVHKQHPRTFSIPRHDIRSSLRPGALAKLIFLADGEGCPEAERMWVQVESVDSEGRYMGRLDNVPNALTELVPGVSVPFGPEHVAAIDEQDPETLAAVDPERVAIVSRRVWEDDEFPRRLERHAVPDPEFTGWFVLAGDESPSFKADRDNFLPLRNVQLFERFRVVDSAMEGPVGSVWVWSNDADEYLPEKGLEDSEKER